MNRYPKISVVTPSYNQAAYLRRTMESVLSQNYPNLEFIIIDGGSKDGSVEIIREFEGRLAYWQSKPDNGQGDAICQGMAIASGEIVCWLNSDDIFLPGALQHVAEMFCSDPDVEVVNGGGFVIDEFDRPKFIRLWGYTEGVAATFDRLRWYGQDGILQQATFWRKTAYEAVGGVDPALFFVMDLDLFARLAKRKTFRRTKRLLACFRLHAESKSTTAMDRHDAEIGHFRNKYAPSRPLVRFVRYWLYRIFSLVRRVCIVVPVRLGLKRLPSLPATQTAIGFSA